MSPFLEAGANLAQEMGKLGISYKDISEETRVWVTTLTGHERRELIGKIKRLRNDMVELSGKLAAQEGKFKNFKVVLDTTLAVAESLYGEFREQLYAPPPLLSRMVEAGLLGRKTGRGFYDYRK